MSGKAETEVDAVIAALRCAEARRRTDPSSRAPEPARTAAPLAYDFADLPAHRSVQMQLAALAALGLEAPYFRLGEHGATLDAVVEGVAQTNFASYDYLDLNGHPEVMQAAQDAIARWGVSPSASRLAGGERPYHRSLEAALAAMQGTEAALAMVSGHATNMSTIAAMVGPEDLVIVDQLSHNSVSEGVRLSGATRLMAPHNDLDWIANALARRRRDHRHALICVEGLYSMDGDTPDLAGLVEIKRQHGAWLMVDEAHALGVLGATGRGLAETSGIAPREVEIWMGTLSKTLASCGGYICGSSALIAHLRTRAPGFVYSVGLAAPLAATAETALAVMLREPDRVLRLADRGQRFRAQAAAAGLDTGLSEGHAVCPIIVGDSLRAVRASAALGRRGVQALPIVHPAVPERMARLRFFVTAAHTNAQIDHAVAATAAVLAEN